MKRPTIYILLAAALFLAGVGSAQPAAEIHGTTPPEPPRLSEAQLQQFDSLRIAHLREVLPLQTELRIKELELEALWAAEEPNANKILAKAREINDIRGRLQLARVNHRLAAYRLLSREQRRFAPFYLDMGRGRKLHGRRMMDRMMERGGMGGCGGRCPQCPQYMVPPPQTETD